MESINKRYINLCVRMTAIKGFNIIFLSVYMKKILLIVWLVTLAVGCHAQGFSSVKDVKAEWERIRSDQNYLYGVGNGRTEKEALDEAKSNLSGMISTTIKTDFNYKVTQETSGTDIQVKDRMEHIVTSYSRSTLNSLKQLTLSEAPKARVVVYIHRDELKRQYEERKNRALVCLEEANAAKAAGRLDETFDKLHIAEMLVSTCNGTVDVPIGFSQKKNAGDYINDEKSAIAKDIAVEEVDMYEDGDNEIITVMFRYKGMPAGNLSYSYEVNGTASDVCVANGGKGYVIVPKKFRKRPNDNFRVNVGYFSGDINKIDIADADVRQIVSPCRVVDYRENRSLVAKAAPQEAADAETRLSSVSEGKFPVVPLGEAEAAPFLETMRQMEVIIRNRNYSAAAKLCTPEGFDMFNKLINYGSARLLNAPDVQFLRCCDDITCRSFPMSFSFKSSARKFTEDVVFHFNPEGKVTEVAFALDDRYADEILNNKNDKYYDNDAKQVIVNFLERYKTAFALKRMDYIESIFSGDALIIVGSVLKKADNYTDMAKMRIKEDEVRYTRLTKNEYMNNLARCFDSNEYINIRFADKTVTSANSIRGNNHLYTIQIKQDYFSQTYSDTGYLFLLLDIEDPQRPIINVRAWQPEKDSRFKADGRISLNDFTWE